MQPLPQRVRRDRSRKDIGIVGDSVVTPLQSSVEIALDNVEKRSRTNQKRKLSTLQSRDGCAGENFEYLDHTADVELHVWGESLKRAFETVVPCMINYMTELESIEEDPDETLHIIVSGHDLDSLLVAYLNEVLFRFSADGFVSKRVIISTFDRTQPLTLEAYL